MLLAHLPRDHSPVPSDPQQVIPGQEDWLYKTPGRYHIWGQSSLGTGRRVSGFCRTRRAGSLIIHKDRPWLKRTQGFLCLKRDYPIHLPRYHESAGTPPHSCVRSTSLRRSTEQPRGLRNLPPVHGLQPQEEPDLTPCAGASLENLVAQRLHAYVTSCFINFCFYFHLRPFPTFF